MQGLGGACACRFLSIQKATLRRRCLDRRASSLRSRRSRLSNNRLAHGWIITEHIWRLHSTLRSTNLCRLRRLGAIFIEVSRRNQRLVLIVDLGGSLLCLRAAKGKRLLLLYRLFKRCARQISGSREGSGCFLVRSRICSSDLFFSCWLFIFLLIHFLFFFFGDVIILSFRFDL